MKLADLPCGMVDWASVPPTTHPGETGRATQRARHLGDIQLRLVEYSAGYLADHWCDKGHIILVTHGAMTLEHRDGTRYELAAGASWHVGENGAAAHRVVSAGGAAAFIVD
jgi:hypothetical protein